MTEIIAGPGLISQKSISYLNGNQIEMVELRLDTCSMVIDPQMIAVASGKPGQVLGIDNTGNVSWIDPFDNDKELREKYPSLEESWNILLAALEEYHLVKKLVEDHDK